MITILLIVRPKRYIPRRTYLLRKKEVSVGENKKSKGKIVIGILFKDKEDYGKYGYGFTSNFSWNSTICLDK